MTADSAEIAIGLRRPDNEPFVATIVPASIVAIQSIRKDRLKNGP